MPERLLRQTEVMARTGLSRTAIYEMEARGEFPRRRRIGTRHIAWLESEIDAWIAARPVVGADDDAGALAGTGEAA